MDAARALAYDYGPGRAMEHTNARRVAGTVPGRDWRARGRMMQTQLREAGDTRPGGPQRVWRLAIAAAPEDRIMSDREWAGIADRVVGEFTRRDPHAYSWEAVRHDARHIHVTLLHRGADGRVFREGMYKKRCLEIAAGLERDHQLRSLSAERATERTPQVRQRRRGETAAARRRHQRGGRPRQPAVGDRAPAATAQDRGGSRGLWDAAVLGSRPPQWDRWDDQRQREFIRARIHDHQKSARLNRNRDRDRDEGIDR
ncbi:hypothetical protein H7J77_11715 [Mycolicibacillus parakoreensis]|uniref:Mobilization protein n=1 Tax=Mycolicibacillus parakoreensis TaxID=1069221 RepID=A0ABY3U7S3_9MYCO|nr:hypothetical protein [Mycolicibacillus parakoreensis]MCV7316204.1 hypothetical protein [Mycolicibacillus parakoreensis]ULN54803.1 hypothetical protein MIU77_18835 [Mycolicibacillus parakoreensis]